ncbi:hypothetical protein ACHAQA_006605 [Verticillium albo-atrum]
MQLTTSALGVFALLLTGASAVNQMQINYYNDQKCSAYAGKVTVTWADEGGSRCYNYNYGSSVNIADCWGRYCQCQFHHARDCQGSYGFVSAYQPGQNCLSNAGQFNSFRCFWDR